jgi:hypothetical protein
MASTDVSGEATSPADAAKHAGMRLEVVVLPVAADRARS